MKIILTIITFCFLASCNNKSAQNENIQLSTLDTSNIASSNLKQTGDASLISNADELSEKEKNILAKILEVGQFHADEVEKGAKNKKWIGIFKNKQGYYLAETKIKISKWNDGIMGGYGLEVNTINKDLCLLLISGLDYLKNHKIETVKISTDYIMPNGSLGFKYNSFSYKFYATGKTQKIQGEENNTEIVDYKLFFTALKDGQSFSDLLVKDSHFSGQVFPNIIFSGDIDGDGQLDFIINTSTNQNGSSITLYLSKPASKGKLLKGVGSFMTVGC